MNEETKIWYSAYPEGVAHTIDLTKYDSLEDLFHKSVEKYSDQVCYSFMGKNMTFRQWDKLSSDFAAFLQGLGLKPKAKIALQMPNVLQYPISVMGAIKAGLVIVNTNPLYTPREMLHQFKDSEAEAIVILENFAHNLEKVLEQSKIRHVIITRIGDMLGGLRGTVTDLAVKHIRKMIPKYTLTEVHFFKKALKIGAQKKLKKVQHTPEDTVLIQYTGGTTGVAKGAELSHKNIMANVDGISKWFLPVSQEPIRRLVLGALPLYHIFALTLNVFAGLVLGFENILVVNPRDQKSLIKTLKKHKFFILPGLNTLFNALIENPEFKKVNFQNLRVTIAGGMALQSHVADKWVEITNCKITEGYGLSETSPVVSCNPVIGQQIGTVGIPFPSTDVRILLADKSWADIGQEGEVCVHGPQVMKGYYNRPEETAEVFMKDENGRGFFLTGDIGLFHEDGFLELVDRKKDMINISGFNVYPNEIEEVISSMPEVLESAVVGVQDDNENEVVKAFVVKKDPTLNQEKVKEYAAENLTNYKRPKIIEFREELPKNNIGKILRRKLK